MTTIGASSYGPETVMTVDSVDTWVRLHALAGADLPDQGSSEDYVFAAWWDFGHFAPRPGVVNALAEVTIGSGDTPFFALNALAEARALLAYPPLGASTVPGRTIPCFQVYGRTAAVRGGWNTTSDFYVWARISSNGDPAGVVAGSSFVVGNIGIMAFSLANLSSTEFAHELWIPSVPVTGTSSPAGHTTSLAPWNDGEGTWLAMFSALHAPSPATKVAGTRADLLLSKYVGSPPSSDVVRMTGYGSNGTNGGHGRLHLLPANWTPQGLSGLSNRMHEGGFYVLEDPDVAAEFAVDIRTNTTSPSGSIIKWEVFAIRADSDAAAGGLGSFAYTQKRAGSTPSATVVGDIFNSSAVPFGTETREERPLGGPKTQATDVHFQVAPLYLGNTGAASWQPRIIETTGEGSILPQVAPFHSGPRSNGDSPMLHVGGLVPRRINVLDYELLAIQNVSEGAAGETMLPAESYLAFGWHWENNPAITTAALPAVPPATSIIPGRESPNVSSLGALPNGSSGNQLLPDIRQYLESVVDRHSFDSDDSTRLTWPAFMAPRRRFRLRWSNLSVPDRDLVLAFLALQSSRIWKLELLNPPSTFIPVVQTSDPRVSDSGLTHSIDLEVVELIWTS